MTVNDFRGLAIIVVNYGSSALLQANLAPLTRRQPALTVVVVDNYSTDSERARLAELADREGWHTVLPTGNTGFGGGMNRGVLRAEQLGATHLLLLNPDAEIAEAAIDALLSASKASPDTLFAPQILRPDGSVWFAGSDLYLNDGRIRSARRRIPSALADIQPWLSGACLLLSIELWRLAEGFDEEYFLYWEDVDFSRRVVAAGGRIAVLTKALAVHAEGGTQHSGGKSHSGEPKSNVYYYYNIRNRLLYAVRHLDTASLEHWRRLTVPVAWEVLLQGGRRQFTSSLSPLVAAYCGVRDGRRMVRDELKLRRRTTYTTD
ncbi:glycosyltransferase family 2 protein [Subtercola sp. YIM 133946]|uniref:glycosyltransferase family 2 protein n=1 Tax=Subtercola sp. YIM 133946 TaxID=3118909 RepID=UPI002F9305C3